MRQGTNDNPPEVSSGRFNEENHLSFLIKFVHRQPAAMQSLMHQSQASVAGVTGRGRECLRPFRGQPVAVAPYQIRRYALEHGSALQRCRDLLKDAQNCHIGICHPCR